MDDNDDRGITCLTVLSATQVYHVSVVCANTGHSQNYQCIYAVIFEHLPVLPGSSPSIIISNFNAVSWVCGYLLSKRV